MTPLHSGFFPVSSTSTSKPQCAECKRLRAALEKMRDLPLSQRVSYVYVALIREALEGK